MHPRTSLLVITASPRERPSSPALRGILAEAERRADIEPHLWFLRYGYDGPRTDGADFVSGETETFVVDSLRSWAPAAAFRGIGLEPVAGLLRGRALRRRLAAVAPDVVLLDDGLGDRVLGTAYRDVPRVVRCNADHPVGAESEQDRTTGVAAWLVDRGSASPAAEGLVVEVSPHLDSFDAARAVGLGDPQRALRQALGIGPEEPVVTGWGGGGWIDGVDLFLRGLWMLEHRHGIAAHGAWFGDDVHPDEVARFAAEAERCGVGDRWHLVSGAGLERYRGEVAFLPYRCEGDRSVLEALAAGMVVVGFEGLGYDDEGPTLVGHLDLEAAAAALAPGLRGAGAERSAQIAAARTRFDAAHVVDRMLEAAGCVPT